MNTPFSKTLDYLMYLNHYRVSTVGNKVGKSGYEISAYLRDKTLPNSTTLHKLAKAFGVTMDYLFTGEDNLPWIPVEKRQPEDMQRVIISYRVDDGSKPKGIDLATYSEKLNTFITSEIHPPITVQAWMPAEPYKEPVKEDED